MPTKADLVEENKELEDRVRKLELEIRDIRDGGVTLRFGDDRRDKINIYETTSGRDEAVLSISFDAEIAIIPIANNCIRIIKIKGMK